MRKALEPIFYIGLGLFIVWSLLTIWVNFVGTEKLSSIGDPLAAKKVLIVYNPDPIYNLDEQVCTGFAQGISQRGFIATIATTSLAELDTTEYDLYVFCANTYNWAPDWQIARLIKRHPALAFKNTIAITLGAGSTDRAKRLLESIILTKQGNLLESRSFWSLKPNDDNFPNENNIHLAVKMAKGWGEEIGQRLDER